MESLWAGLISAAWQRPGAREQGEEQVDFHGLRGAAFRRRTRAGKRTIARKNNRAAAELSVILPKQHFFVAWVAA